MNHWSDWFPIVFLPFKLIVLAVGAYFAIKWHRDQDKKIEAEKARKQALKGENNGHP